MSIDMSGATTDELTAAVTNNSAGLKTDVGALIANNPPPPELINSIREAGMGTRDTSRVR
jgi:hypothetical protein